MSKLDIEIAWDDYESFLYDQKKKDEKTDKGICCDGKTINNRSGDIICTSCGKVLKHVLDEGPDWSFYTSDKPGGDINQARCGHPINPLLPVSSLSTSFASKGGLATDANVYKIAKWIQMPYEEKALLKIFNKIERFCSQHEFNSSIIQSAKYYFREFYINKSDDDICCRDFCICTKNISCFTRKISGATYFLYNDESLEVFTPDVYKKKSGIKRGKNLDGMVAVCIEQAAKNHGNNTLTDKKLMEVFNLDNKHMSDAREELDNTVFSRQNNMKRKDEFCSSLISSLCLNLIDKEDDVSKLFIWIKTNKFLSSKADLSIIAGCIYYTADYFKIDLSCEKVKNICGVSETTIKKVYKEIDSAIKESRSKLNQ